MLRWTERQTDNQSEQRNVTSTATRVSGTVALLCDWLSCVRAAGNRFEWETVQTQSHVQTESEAQRFG